MSGSVYLVGMPGSGKSSVGRALSSRLALPFIDLDEEIEAAAGATIAEIFAGVDGGVAAGEAAFRQLETAALSRVSARNRAVVACGGGAILSEDNRTLMHDSGTVVWLKVRPEMLARRDLTGRPLLVQAGDLERLSAEREPAYREASDIEIDAEADPDSVAAAVEAAVKALPA